MQGRALGVLAAAFLGGAAVQLVFLGTTQAVAQQAPVPSPAPAPVDVVRARQFVLVDSGGRERARLQAPEKGTIGMVVLDDNGKPVVDVGIMPDRLRGLKVNDGTCETLFGGGIGIMSVDGKLRFGLGFTDQGSGGVTLCDEQGRERVSLGMPAKGGYSMSIKDEGGAVLWSAP